MSVKVPCMLIRDGARMPQVSQQGDAAADVFACQERVIPARGRALVPTGIVLELPKGYCASLRSRSGLSLRHGIEVGAGLIDSGYRGEVGVLLYNHGDQDYEIQAGDRIAQMRVEAYQEPVFLEVKQVSNTQRGMGWGSSGK